MRSSIGWLSSGRLSGMKKVWNAFMAARTVPAEGRCVPVLETDHQGLEAIYYSRLAQDGTFQIFSP